MNTMHNSKKMMYKIIKETIERQKSKLKKFKKIKIVCIITAYNEEDIIGHVLEDFISKGIKVYFIDHHSTDNTLVQAKKFKSKGIIGTETFPEESGYSSELRDVYAWRYILERKEELHSTLGADWYMHMDADAIIESPWDEVPLLDAIQLVDALGYNCINFELFNFRPLIDSYKANSKPQDFFKYWEPADSFDEYQVKCWKNFGQSIDLVSSGGHDVQFKGKKIFPLKFIMRHYPLRSREHAIKKIFSNRLPRIDSREKGWHSQYDRYADNKNIEFHKRDLLQYDQKIVKQIYLPFINYFNINSVISEKEQHIQNLNSQIESIYASRTWKVGMAVTATWRWFKKIF